VDEKRSYACDITLARLRLTHEHIRDAILAMDEKVVTPEILGSLIKVRLG
jgi:hypothetical protein